MHLTLAFMFLTRIEGLDLSAASGLAAGANRSRLRRHVYETASRTVCSGALAVHIYEGTAGEEL